MWPSNAFITVAVAVFACNNASICKCISQDENVNHHSFIVKSHG